MKDTYIIKASKDDKVWETKAVFSKGDRSRFDKPFDAEIAVKEAKAFKKARGNDYPYVAVEIKV